MNKKNGFTLVEILVAVTIMAFLGIVAIVNFKGVSSDTILSKAQGQIQSYLRIAQINATSSILCDGMGGAGWSIRFRTDDKAKLDLNCEKSLVVIRTFTLENAEVASIKGSSCPLDSYPVSFLDVTFSTLYGVPEFSGIDACLGSSSTLTLTIRNLKNGNQKSFKISEGGALDVQ